MPSLLRRELGNDYRRRPIPLGKETGNQDATVPEPHKISHKSSYKFHQLDMSSCYLIVRPQGFMAAQRSCFIKQGRPAVAFHTIVRRRTRYIPTSDQALCPVGIPRRKAASKADKCTTNVPPYAVGKGHPERCKKHRTHAVKRRRKHYEPQMRPRLV